MLKRIKSIGELERLAASDERYADLAIAASDNLGGTAITVTDAICWLRTNAMETDEDGVVEEINFMRGIINV